MGKYKTRKNLQALEEFGIHPEAKGSTEGFSRRKSMNQVLVLESALQLQFYKADWENEEKKVRTETGILLQTLYHTHKKGIFMLYISLTKTYNEDKESQ